jgi:hypothetical protein
LTLQNEQHSIKLLDTGAALYRAYYDVPLTKPTQAVPQLMRKLYSSSGHKMGLADISPPWTHLSCVGAFVATPPMALAAPLDTAVSEGEPGGSRQPSSSGGVTLDQTAVMNRRKFCSRWAFNMTRGYPSSHTLKTAEQFEVGNESVLLNDISDTVFEFEEVTQLLSSISGE